MGKTLTARRRARTVHALDAPGAVELFAADPRRLVDGDPPVLLDEWQRIPASWDIVRRTVDDEPTPGRFLLTGSAAPAGGGTHSGGGRIVRVRMRPLALAERGVGTPTVSLRELLDGGRPPLAGSTSVDVETYASEICRSGLPGLRGLSGRALRAQLDGYLEPLWILDPVPAWLPTSSHLRRLGSAPRHHLADPALAARLLGVEPGALLAVRSDGPLTPRDGTLLGQLFESLVTLDARVYAQATEARVDHLRTHGGEHEVDLIVERGVHRVVAVEVKLARTVREGDLHHLRWLRDRLGDDLLDAIVVTTGSDTYRRSDGIGIVRAALLGP